MRATARLKMAYSWRVVRHNSGAQRARMLPKKTLTCQTHLRPVEVGGTPCDENCFTAPLRQVRSASPAIANTALPKPTVIGGKNGSKRL